MLYDIDQRSCVPCFNPAFIKKIPEFFPEPTKCYVAGAVTVTATGDGCSIPFPESIWLPDPNKYADSPVSV